MPADAALSSELELAADVLEAARRAGAMQAEVTVSTGDRFDVEARDRAVAKLEQATSRTLYVRLFLNGRKASLTTSTTDRAQLARAIDYALAQAAHVAPDPHAGLPLPNERDPLDEDDLELFSGDVEARPPQEKIDEALDMERRIRSTDERIENSNGSHVGDRSGARVLANSNGFCGAYRWTSAHRSSSPVAQDGSNKRTASYGTAGRTLEALESVERVCRRAVERTVGLCGARKPSTMRVPVIFERDIAASVLADVFAAASAANVAVGNSWLADSGGSRIGSELVTIIDDGTIPGALGSAPFDAEGVPTRRNVVIERGVLQTFLYDTYYARRLGAQSTGNAGAGGVCANNFYLEPGIESLDDIIASTQRGVLVLNTIGFATEHASGIYSRGANGFYIEDGEIAYPIEEFTIAGTFRQMLGGLDAVANDLRFDAGIVSPSFRVAEMTVSGD